MGGMGTRLSAAGTPDDAYALARGDLERDVVQDLRAVLQVLSGFWVDGTGEWTYGGVARGEVLDYEVAACGPVCGRYTAWSGLGLLFYG